MACNVKYLYKKFLIKSSIVAFKIFSLSNLSTSKIFTF